MKEYNFGDIGENIFQDYAYQIWDNVDGSYMALGPLFSLLPFSDQQFQEMISISTGKAEKAEHYNIILTRTLAEEIKKTNIGKSLLAAEIGGTALAKVMEVLGSKAIYVDSRHPDYMVTPNNYQNLFPQLYDFTLSNWLFDEGSGLEGCNYYQMMEIFSHLTAPGGYSIHGGITINYSDRVLNDLGFEKVLQQGGNLEDGLLVLTKIR